MAQSLAFNLNSTFDSVYYKPVDFVFCDNYLTLIQIFAFVFPKNRMVSTHCNADFGKTKIFSIEINIMFQIGKKLYWIFITNLLIL